jgi:hypothetical protein
MTVITTQNPSATWSDWELMPRSKTRENMAAGGKRPRKVPNQAKASAFETGRVIRMASASSRSRRASLRLCGPSQRASSPLSQLTRASTL